MNALDAENDACLFDLVGIFVSGSGKWEDESVSSITAGVDEFPTDGETSVL